MPAATTPIPARRWTSAPEPQKQPPNEGLRAPSAGAPPLTRPAAGGAEGPAVPRRSTGGPPRLPASAGRSGFNLPVLPAGDFPVMSSDGLSGRLAVDAADLIRLIDKTKFAISAEEARYYLNGRHLHTVVEDGRTRRRAAATDLRRLAEAAR